MSSLVLLNSDGTVARKLHLVSLPDDFVVPEGKIVSWRIAIHRANIYMRSEEGIEPLEAAFYFGDAWALVERCNFQEFERVSKWQTRYSARDLTVIVQGTSPRDVMWLRDHIMHLINLGASWGVRNDLNPKPKGFRVWLRKLVRKAS